MGPEGGRNGGMVVAPGTPEEVAAQKKGYTSKYIELLFLSFLWYVKKKTSKQTLTGFLFPFLSSSPLKQRLEYVSFVLQAI